MRGTRGARALPSPRSTPCPLAFGLFLLLGAVRGQGSFRLPRPLTNLAVSKRHVFVASESQLYQLSPSLQQELSVPSQAGEGRPGCPPPTVNQLLIVQEEEGVLFSCWNQRDGLCQRRNLSHVGSVQGNSTNLVSCHPGQPTAGLAYRIGGVTYLLVAASYSPAGVRDCCPAFAQHYSKEAISIRERDLRKGSYENSLGLREPAASLRFVDAFPWRQDVFVPYYPYNYSAGAVAGEPAMVDIRQTGGPLTLRGEAALGCRAGSGRRAIVASALIRGPGLWAGVFASETARRAAAADRTALCLFDLTEIQGRAAGCRPRRFSDPILDGGGAACADPSKPVDPISKAPTLVHSDLSSVHGVELRGRIVLFLGTGDGQLLKVMLDENMQADCPEVLYEIEEETPVFHKLEFNPVNQNYIYLPTTYEVKQIKVANCEKYESCKHCLSARDPYCGWCHSSKRCTLQEECSHLSNSGTWLDISEGPSQCLTIQVIPSGTKQIIEVAFDKVAGQRENRSSCQVKKSATGAVLCEGVAEPTARCSCNVTAKELSKTELLVAEVMLSSRTLSERFQFRNCSELPSRKTACSECIARGCVWCAQVADCRSSLLACGRGADVADQAGYCAVVDEQTVSSSTASPSETKSVSQDLKPIIHSIEPQRISTLGKSKVTIAGQNLGALSKMFLSGTSSCGSVQIPVNLTSDALAVLSLPPGRKEVKALCVNLKDGNCSLVHYVSLPSCQRIHPKTTWLSAGRNITIIGKNVDLIDNLAISEESRSTLDDISLLSGNRSHRRFLSPRPSRTEPNQRFLLKLNVQGHGRDCATLQYLADPIFTNFELHTEVDSELGLTLTKEKDQLNITSDEFRIVVSHEDKRYLCEVDSIVENLEYNTIHCKANRTANEKIDRSKVEVCVHLGNFTTKMIPRSSYYIYFFLVIPCILLVVIIAVLVTRHKSKQLNHKLSQELEMLECEIRKEIRVGFAELQMDKLDVVATSGTIPFLDYKHFALRTFFPESLGSAFNSMEELCATLPPSFQTGDPVEQNECLTELSALICNKTFLVALIHTLENQNSFSIKDRCMFASFLAVALQNKLVYLTRILEVLTRDLMEQCSSSHPKLMLRRTESVMEKLLTNWMSTCLYGFLRERVGESLYLLVTMLNQRIHKGPVDAITCKALFTLNEDWLLWQVAEFNPVELNVVFPRVSDNESEDAACQNLQVNVLDCDTIGQAKDKILQAFLSKNGYPYGIPVGETGLELHVGQQRKELLDIDDSSVTLEHGKTKLNTIGHYKISDGATINVLKKKTHCPSATKFLQASTVGVCWTSPPRSLTQSARF
ncbi:plexin-C1 isoform X2 [Rhinatrema bivittatum]|uniref:plexin-C1 isoform X2 n=1 Tax=Rhinatrema bivittatum TaxID=194408 RepID=UPI0011297DC3|nr:plexin-C1 isoform X2 [Rhinatrema bivittatum]